jgi:hypothetical protein
MLHYLFSSKQTQQQKGNKQALPIKNGIDTNILAKARRCKKNILFLNYLWLADINVVHARLSHLSEFVFTFRCIMFGQSTAMQSCWFYLFKLLHKR